MASIETTLSQADNLRRRGAWRDATRLYEAVLETQPSLGPVILNLSLCYLAIGSYKKAEKLALTMPTGDPNHWRAYIAYARSLVAQGKIEHAISALSNALERNPAQGDLALELADLYMQRIGDAEAARKCVEPFIDDPKFADTAGQTYIVASLYDRECSAEALVARIRRFADALSPSGRRKHVRFKRDKKDAKKRVGLISKYFSVSPVYFFTYGVLAELQDKVELVFFDRGSKKDWAYERFQGIASEWIDVDQATPAKLSESLEAAHLDVLLEMAGWSDVDVLRGIAGKPCPKIYKWVGGQSATTGLKVYDGFISDVVQTPPATQHLYSEPLINLPTGYVTYVPPDYLPAPVPSHREILVLGIIGNPLKISGSFLKVLGRTLLETAAKLPVPMAIQFIDSRYGSTLVQERIKAALRPTLGHCKEIAVLFTAPGGHQEFLGHLSRLTAVVDTSPYSAGLTAIEALAMGVPIIGTPGALCSERHAASHQYFASVGQSIAELSAVNLLALQRSAGQPRQSRLAGSPRSKHADVANELFNLIVK